MYTGSLYIAGDHGGYALKKRLVRFIENELARPIEDMGPLQFGEHDDYTDYAFPLAERVVKENARGILVCRNGIGVCMAANKVRGVRAGIGYNIAAAESMMKDDNTNILCLAADHLSEDFAMAIVKRWLETPFSEAERHVRRLGKIQEYEKGV
ncbi:MAG TPA: RpiB/LacA/LacB family sugar-phosphate isomerase [Candidatus Magasanikbacteria bacterium]|nr:RpiB/LacA/LacB family sugar-phosphate isomerase [Candidatus Magasanikbacteria bacterium]